MSRSLTHRAFGQNTSFFWCCHGLNKSQIKRVKVSAPSGIKINRLLFCIQVEILHQLLIHSAGQIKYLNEYEYIWFPCNKPTLDLEVAEVKDAWMRMMALKGFQTLFINSSRPFTSAASITAWLKYHLLHQSLGFFLSRWRQRAEGTGNTDELLYSCCVKIVPKEDFEHQGCLDLCFFF